MVDDDGGCAAFGHDTFADTVGNVWIDFRNVASDDGCGVGTVYPELLSRKPFAGAMAAEMDHGVRMEDAIEPQIDGEILMVRRQFF